MLDVEHGVSLFLFLPFVFFSREWGWGFETWSQMIKEIKSSDLFSVYSLFHFGGTEKGGQSASDVTNTTVCVHVRAKNAHATTHTYTLSLENCTHTQTHTHDTCFIRLFRALSRVQSVESTGAFSCYSSPSSAGAGFGAGPLLKRGCYGFESENRTPAARRSLSHVSSSEDDC